ncbi:CBS domain-containing protein [Sphaerisporangium album]|uniref:CBS domain-containing protein n=1 Tax=Sphaerisporangium album TaxID=509200 RepID=A0A367F786_9ACTN|nr:CBS domain-containing protein [Sphaerisporangium album]RCG26226.1 CBS domain-containing protein [Sphaerisporangium album]
MVMRVGDVMGRVAIAVRPETSFADLVATMRRFKVGAVAVIDADRRPVGMVSAHDLLLKEIEEPGHRRVFEGRARRAERAKAAGGTAGQLMTTPPITVTGRTTVREAARIMHDHHVRQLPVVGEDGKIVGTVHQSDLLKVFARPPEEVRADVEAALARAGVDPRALTAAIEPGLVSLRGMVPRRSQIAAVVDGVRAVDGVIEVDDRLSYETDDLVTVPPLYL